MQCVEIGDAVSAEHHGLAVDDELLEPVHCMLRRRVWSQTRMGSDYFAGVLCLDCIERRLGRRLRLSDFAIARTKADRRLWTLGKPMLPRVWEGRTASASRQEQAHG
jgi:hypothetical protein